MDYTDRWEYYKVNISVFISTKKPYDKLQRKIYGWIQEEIISEGFRERIKTYI